MFITSANEGGSNKNKQIREAAASLRYSLLASSTLLFIYNVNMVYVWLNLTVIISVIIYIFLEPILLFW